MSSSGTIVHEAVKVHHQTFKTYRVRVIVAGDATVGKTAITKLLASSGSDHPRNYVMTSVPELSSRILRIPANDLPSEAPSCQVDLLLLDTPGSTTINMREAASLLHWNTAGAIALVFDLGNRESFTSLAKWLRRAQENISQNPLLGVIIGNKSDFREPEQNRAEITTNEAKAFADSVRMPYYEVSAERNFDIEKPFLYLATQYCKRRLDDEEEEE